MISQLVVGTRDPKDSSLFSAHGPHIPPSQPTPTLPVQHCSTCMVPRRSPEGQEWGWSTPSLAGLLHSLSPGAS